MFAPRVNVENSSAIFYYFDLTLQITFTMTLMGMK